MGVTAHFVRVGGPDMHTVAQMTAGGLYPGSDCAVADIRSVLLDRGIDVSVRTLEQQAGTTSRGTSVEAIVTVLAMHHIPSYIVAGSPAPDWVMNSAWGGMVSPVVYPLYARASLGRYVQIDDGAIPVSNPTPVIRATPESAQPVDMLTAFDVTPDNTQRAFWASTTAHHVTELTRDPAGVEHSTDHTVVNGFPVATGSGQASHAPDGSTVFLFYESAAGRVEAWYDVKSGTWQTKQLTGPS